MRYHLQAGATVLDLDTMTSVPANGETLGEIMFELMSNLVYGGREGFEKVVVAVA